MAFVRALLLWILGLLGCSAPAADESGVKGTPFCRRIRSCLQQKLPKSYASELHDEVLSQAAECMGRDTTSVWTTHDCLPLEFARDEHGIGVEVLVNCNDICPMHASILIRYAEAVSALECDCMGADARFDAAFGAYQHCVPRPRAKDSRTLRVRETRLPDRFEVVSTGPIASALGFNLPVLAMDDVTLRTREALDHALSQLPETLPRSLTVAAIPRADTQPVEPVVVYYPPRAVFEELSRLAQDIDFEHLGTRAAACPGARTSDHGIRIGEHFVPFDRQCERDVTHKLMRLATRIERAATEATPRKLDPQASPACRELRSLPSVIALREAGKVIELRYVDWLAR